MRALMLMSVVALAGCAGLSHEPPVSTAQSMAGGPPEQMPQSPNSLPPGSQVSAPFTPDVGNVSTLRVGPSSNATPASSAQQPHVGTGTATETGTGHSVTNSY
jgi:hypothetical protein